MSNQSNNVKFQVKTNKITNGIRIVLIMSIEESKSNVYLDELYNESKNLEEKLRNGEENSNAKKELTNHFQSIALRNKIEDLRSQLEGSVKILKHLERSESQEEKTKLERGAKLDATKNYLCSNRHVEPSQNQRDKQCYYMANRMPAEKESTVVWNALIDERLQNFILKHTQKKNKDEDEEEKERALAKKLEDWKEGRKNYEMSNHYRVEVERAYKSGGESPKKRERKYEHKKLSKRRESEERIRSEFEEGVRRGRRREIQKEIEREIEKIERRRGNQSANKYAKVYPCDQVHRCDEFNCDGIDYDYDVTYDVNNYDGTNRCNKVNQYDTFHVSCPYRFEQNIQKKIKPVKELKCLWEARANSNTIDSSSYRSYAKPKGSGAFQRVKAILKLPTEVIVVQLRTVIKQAMYTLKKNKSIYLIFLLGLILGTIATISATRRKMNSKSLAEKYLMGMFNNYLSIIMYGMRVTLTSLAKFCMVMSFFAQGLVNFLSPNEFE